MDNVYLDTPVLIKLGSFAGKTKYCLIDTYFIPVLKYIRLSIEQFSNQLIVITKRHDQNDDEFVSLHRLVWEDFNHCPLPKNYCVYHKNGETMDNRYENLILLPQSVPFFSIRSSSSFYWNLISSLPVDMDEIEHHQHESSQSDVIECHHAPCSNILSISTVEQLECLACKKTRYCSRRCQMLDADIHSVFCNPFDSK